MSASHVLTTCPYCGTGCNFFLQVVDGRAVGVVPCKTDEISQGRLCIKGYNAHAFIHHRDRLTSPLIRSGGQMREASWDEALDKVVAEVRRIIDRHGPDSVLVLASAKCTNEENYLFQKLARAAIGTNNVDHCARLCHASTVTGLLASFGSGAMTNTIGEFEDAECILVTGSNTLEAHPLIGARMVRARDRGAKIIVIDPRETPLSRVAELSLNQRPGTDIAWINGMVKVIIDEGMVNEGFVKSRTEAFEELKEAVKDYSLERVEAITGIPKDRLRDAARLYAKADKAMIAYAMGVTQHSNGTNIVKALANLAMVTGHLGRESTGVNPLRGQCNVQGACDAGGLPNLFPGYLRVDDPEARARYEKAWGRRLPEKPGLTLTRAIEEARDGKVKALIVFGENPMVSDPDIGHVEEALKGLEFVAVCDIFMTETAQLAHVVLPAACYAEKDGTFTNTDRAIRVLRKAVEPPGEAWPDWRVACELGRRLGATGFAFGSPAEVMDEMASLAPIYGGVSIARADTQVLRWPCPAKDHPGTKVLHTQKFTRGLGMFVPVHHAPPAEETSDEFPFILTTGRNLFQYHTGTMTRRSPKLEREAPVPYVELNKGDASRLGIADGDRVMVSSRRGSITLVARVTERIIPGTLFIPFHYAEAAANRLTNAALDPAAHIPELKVCAARLQKA
ncbi:MAG: formate dehydrogenase subunit alpha [Euryarchaeota archaeon RBG_16_62_10]|nr:MAG: formate dehydrogenase subunit alpha [Euryarchaeota archaeon RBG_16_62_10]